MLYTYALNIPAAVDYAQKWALSRNPAYYDFQHIGGDCTNFISQCVFAGGAVMNFTPDFGWYYNSLNSRAPAWTGVEFFYRFIIGNRSVGPFGYEIDLSGVQAGDVIQLGGANGVFYHSLFVTYVENGMPHVCAHTFDALNRPLSSYSFSKARVLRIVGARK